MTSLSWLDDQEYRFCVADVQYLMPGYATVGETASREQVNHSNSPIVRNLHLATGDGIAEIRSVEMAFMTDAGRKRVRVRGWTS